MDSYGKVEYKLCNYNMNKIYLDDLEVTINHLKENDGLKGISYDSISTSPTNLTSDSTGDTAISNAEIMDRLVTRLEKGRQELETIDKMLSRLTEIEVKIIKMFYIQGNTPWWKIAYEVQYSERQCRNIRKKVIDKMVVGLYGELLPHDCHL